MVAGIRDISVSRDSDLMYQWIARQLDQRVPYEEIVRAFKYELLNEAYERGGNVKEAAFLLDVPINTFYSFRRRFRLTKRSTNGNISESTKESQ